jgi:hypothetical protein
LTVKKTFQVLTIVGAMALLLGIMMSGSGTVSAAGSLGTVTFNQGTSTATDAGYNNQQQHEHGDERQ